MFIKKSQSGYNRSGEQFARGSFLILFSHNQYEWEHQNNTTHFDTAGTMVTNERGQLECRCGEYHSYETPWVEGSRPDGKGGSWTPGPYYYLKSCPAHGHEYCTMPDILDRKLYACVRHVSLRQSGAWMMGSARIAGQSVTLSGSYGDDGLPCDYEKLTPAARAKLTEVPAAITQQFWHPEFQGHNSAGSEDLIMRQWVLETFK